MRLSLGVLSALILAMPRRFRARGKEWHSRRSANAPRPRHCDLWSALREERSMLLIRPEA